MFEPKMGILDPPPNLDYNFGSDRLAHIRYNLRRNYFHRDVFSVFLKFAKALKACFLAVAEKEDALYLRRKKASPFDSFVSSLSAKRQEAQRMGDEGMVLLMMPWTEKDSSSICSLPLYDSSL